MFQAGRQKAVCGSIFIQLYGAGRNIQYRLVRRSFGRTEENKQ